MKYEINGQSKDLLRSSPHINICCCNLKLSCKQKLIWFSFRYILCSGVLYTKWNWMYYFIFIFRFISSFSMVIIIGYAFWTRNNNVVAFDRDDISMNSDIINSDLISILIVELLIGIPIIFLIINIFHARNYILETHTATPDRTATELVMTGLGHEINDLLLFSRNQKSIKIDINKKDVNNRSPVMFAVTFGDIEGLEKLFEQGADFTQHGSKFSPLTMATFFNYTKCVEFLLDKVPQYNMNEIDPNGHTALTVTCVRNPYNHNKFATEAMLLLLEKYKMDVNNRNKYGETALIVASIKGHLEGVRLLLSKYENSIDVNIQDGTGKTAFMHAKSGNNVQIMKLLQSTQKIDIHASDSN